MAKEKVNEWALTDQEKVELEEFGMQRRGMLITAEAQQVIAARIAKLEKEWWVKALGRLGIEKYERPGISIRVEEGKIIRTVK